MYLVTHLAVLSFVLVNCFNFINKSDAFECLDKVHGSRQLNKQYFVTVRTKNLHDCIDECKARAKCSDINYRRAYGLCQLLEAEAYNVTHRDTISAAGYVYGNKSEWDMVRTFSLMRSLHCTLKVTHIRGEFEKYLARSSISVTGQQTHSRLVSGSQSGMNATDYMQNNYVTPEVRQVDFARDPLRSYFDEPQKKK